MSENNGEAEIEAQCIKCNWYKSQPNPRDLGAKVGLCCRFPPQVVVVPMGAQGVQILTTFPTVQATQWCAEFMPCRVDELM